MPFDREIDDLKNIWVTLFPKMSLPPDSEWTLWLLRHGDKTVRLALAELGGKYKREEGAMSLIWMEKFMSTVANRITNGQPGKYV
jgi:hypothetical protein